MNGLHLAPRWRFAPAFSVGLLGSASWVSNIGRESHTYYSAEAEGRWHPVVGGSVDPWLGLDAGVVTVVDFYDATDYFADETYSHAAPMLGLGVGTEFRVASFLAIGPELRGFALLFNDDRRIDLTGRPRYAAAFGVGLSLSGTLLLGERTD